jgi:Ca2+-binding EF-hand superfamily protein
MTGAAACLLLALAAAFPDEPPPAANGNDAARHLVFLAENRPVFLRLQVRSGDRPFEASWIDSIRILHASLDRNGDGIVTTKEAEAKTAGALVRLATGAAVPPARLELDVNPKDGKVSVDELADALRPILGPFQMQFRRQAIGRTDALFDYLDRDKDGELTRPELAAIAGSLRPLDLDDDEMTSAAELEPMGSPALTSRLDEPSGRATRYTAPTVLESVAGESSLRAARLLLRTYDKGKGDVPGRTDSKLSPGEFAIDPDAFARADKNGDDTLDTEELRQFLAQAPNDLALDVVFPTDTSGRATVRAGAGGVLPKGVQVRQLADGDVELAIGQVRIDIRVDGGKTSAEDAHRLLTQRFKAADANKDGYLEGKETAAIEAPGSPLAGLLEVIDRDGDGKVYFKELLDFADRQLEAARRRLVVTTADEGRAIFVILDLDKDRRLGAREVMRTVDRVLSWDINGDGRISPEEIPYHFQVTIARGGLPGLTGEGVATPAPRGLVASAPDRPAVGPDWFLKMDRNHDGDVSRREFLGPRDQFDRLDRDKDGLIDPDEARAALAANPKDSPRDGSSP